MNKKGSLSSAFNMSLGFIPVIVSTLLCEFIVQDIAIYIGMMSGIALIYLYSKRKKTTVHDFILYITTGILSFLSLVSLVPGNYIPSSALPLTLEICILLPVLTIYLHKQQLSHYLIPKISTNKINTWKQSFESATVSARIVLILGGFHFITILLSTILLHPIPNSYEVFLYKILPPSIFILSILLNQAAIVYFNFTMSQITFIPIVNIEGKVIGKTPFSDVITHENKYLHPIIRISILTHDMLFLCSRSIYPNHDNGKADIPMETYLHYGESLSEGVERLLKRTFPHGRTSIHPKFQLCYHLKNDMTNRLIYLFVANVKDDRLLCSPHFKNSKLWSFRQIEENLNKGFFSSFFEEEYKQARSIYTKEIYKGF